MGNSIIEAQEQLSICLSGERFGYTEDTYCTIRTTVQYMLKMKEEAKVNPWLTSVYHNARAMVINSCNNEAIWWDNKIQKDTPRLDIFTNCFNHSFTKIYPHEQCHRSTTRVP